MVVVIVLVPHLSPITSDYEDARFANASSSLATGCSATSVADCATRMIVVIVGRVARIIVL